MPILTITEIQSILNFSMNGQMFIKSFSRGQITIPKVFRDKLGLEDNFWLKMALENDRLIAEPIAAEPNSKNLSRKLLAVKGDWFNVSDWKKTRREISRRMNAN